jgi:hypothetical protein
MEKSSMESSAAAAKGAVSTPRRRLAAALGLGATVLIAGCAAAYPVNPYTPPPTYYRAWDAVAAAMREQGVGVSFENRDAGTMQGSRGGINVTATVRIQDDGRARVQFDTSGDIASDPTLIDRLTRSYNANMGR